MTMRCISDITEGRPPTEISDSMPKYSASSSKVTSMASQPVGAREIKRDGRRDGKHHKQRHAAQAHRDEQAEHERDRAGLAHEGPADVPLCGDEKSGGQSSKPSNHR